MKQQQKYKNSFITICYLAILLNAAPAIAADWEKVMTSPNHDLLVDLDAYNVQDGLPFITTNTAYKATQNYHVNTVKFDYLQKHTTTQFDCTAHTYKNLKTVYYNRLNQVVARGGAQSQFLAVKPNSTMASLESLVCQVHKMVGGY